MTYSSKIIQTVNSLQDFLQKTTEYRISATDFTRKRKLNFVTCIYLGISLLKKSLNIELYNILTDNDLAHVSASAFSQARYKISSNVYKDLNGILIDKIYAEDGNSDTNFKKFKNYFVDAIDGTMIVLPQQKVLAEHFGMHFNGSKNGTKTATVMAGCVIHADIMNNYILNNLVFSLKKGEATTFYENAYLLRSNAISLFDRGFASTAQFLNLMTLDKPFVFRLKINFSKVVTNFVNSDSQDEIVELIISNTTYMANGPIPEDKKNVEISKSNYYTKITKGDKVKVRLVKVKLSTGETEILATSLFDSVAFSLDDLAFLYNLRWGVETIIDSLKNQLLMMCFSGLKVQAIYQDLYATIVLYNLRQMIINEAQQILDVTHNQKGGKCTHEQKVNKSTAIGILKPKIMKLFLAEKPLTILNEIISILLKTKISKVLNKENPVRRKSLAKRRNLITQSNFKRPM